MEHTSNGNGHHDSSHDMTEGNRQYYPKGWWMPVVGVAIIAFGFIFIGGFVLKISGTDKWGKSDTVKVEQMKPGADGGAMQDNK